MAASKNRAFECRTEHPLERRSRMLKDFLTDDSSSCSSSGFKSFPRRSSSQNHFPLPPLQRSRSKAAATTISALHAVLAAVKRFQSLKSPAAILPRSLSRRRSKKSVRSHEAKKLTLTIKDIIRWRSFRDLAEDESPAPLDFASPPRECTTASSFSSSTATTITSGTPCNSSGSSWCDSDFTAEELLCCWDGNSNSGEKFYGRVGVGKEEEERRRSAVNTKVGPKEEEVELELEDEHSPISVFDVEYEESEVAQSTFNQSNQKLMHKTRRLESVAKWEPLNLEKLMADEETARSSSVAEEANEVERTARQLLEHVRATTNSVDAHCSLDKLLLGFFTEGLTTAASRDNLGIGELNEIIEQAESWIIGEVKLSCLYGGDLALEDKSGSWIKFGEDQEEVAMAIETSMTDFLVDDLVADLFHYSHLVIKARY